MVYNPVPILRSIYLLYKEIMQTIEWFEICHFIFMPWYLIKVCIMIIRLKTYTSLEVIKVLLRTSNVTQIGPGFCY